MNFARCFVLAVLPMASIAWPAAAYSDPAVSLQHLLSDKDCESVSQLVRDWEPKGDLSGIWTIQALGDRKYRLIQRVGESDTSNKAAFDICVAHLGGYLFFDATFQTVRPDGKALWGEDDNLFWIPLHLIGRLDVNDAALHFRLLDDAWLQDQLKSGRLHLTSSQDDEGQYLLTAPSSELKEFAMHFATSAVAFSYVEDFELVPREEANSRHPQPNPKAADRKSQFGNLPSCMRRPKVSPWRSPPSSMLKEYIEQRKPRFNSLKSVTDALCPTLKGEVLRHHGSM